MSVITKVLKQKVVYWPPGEPDRYGRLALGTPVELKARWDEDTEEVTSPDGSKFVPKAEVMVESDVKLGGVLMFGILTDIVDADEPLNNEMAWQISAFTKNPDFKARHFLRIAYLGDPDR